MSGDTVASIRREIAELDKQFDSAENRSTGRLKADEYNQRGKALRERLQDAEQEERRQAEEERIARARRSTSTARPYLMKHEDAKQLRELRRAFDEAIEAGDEGTLVATIQSKDFTRLLYLQELEHAGEVGARAYAAGLGARAALAMHTNSLAAMRRRALEARIKQLETESLRYVGVWRHDTQYVRGNVTTFGGSMWHCQKDTMTKPPSDDWICCVQRGRDAR